MVQLHEQNIRAQSGFSGLASVGGRLKVDKAIGKTLKFRAVTLFTTLGITWLLTGNAMASIGLTALQQSANTAVYYFFEKSERAARTENRN